MIPFYFSGLLTKKYVLDSRVKKHGKWIAIVLLAVAFFTGINGSTDVLPQYIIKGNYAFYCANLVLKYVVAIIWIMGCFSIVSHIENGGVGDVFSTLGSFSLDIYVLQVFPVKMLGRFSPVPDLFFAFNFLYVPIVTIILTLICYLIAKYIIRANKVTALLFLGRIPPREK